MNKNKLPKITLVSIVLAIAIIIWGRIAIAASPVEFRVNALEGEINNIESRLNIIQTQLNQIRPAAPSPAPTSPPRPSPTIGQRPLNREQMFDRLATLVIELKQQVNKLETRVSKLESNK